MMNFKRKQIHNPEVFDINSLEDEIGELVRERPRPAVVEYVPPAPPATVQEIGQVTAEAVMTQYEAAAKSVEDMKAPMLEWSSHCQTALADLAAAMSYIEETAKRFREIGQSTHDRIQKSSAAITEVRQCCDDIRAKIDPQ